MSRIELAKQKASFKEMLNGSNPKICVWWMNIGVEEVENTEQYDNIIPHTVKKTAESIITSMEQLCLAIADEDDIVILRREPSDIVLDGLVRRGVTPPKIFIVEAKHQNYSESILNDTNLISVLKDLNANSDSTFYLMPYKVTSVDLKIREELNCEIVGGLPNPEQDLNDKVITREMCNLLGIPTTRGYVCDNVDDLSQAISELTPSENSLFVLKEYNGVSGKGMFIVTNEYQKNILKSIVNRSSNKKKKIRVIIEEWYKNCIDFNYQLYISDHSTMYYLEPRLQLVENGVYNGTVCHVESITPEEKQKIFDYAKTMGEKLFQIGYRGIASIDGIITEYKDIFPVLEINARFSLSTYIYFLTKSFGENVKCIMRYYNISTDKSSSDLYSIFERYLYHQSKPGGIIFLIYGENISLNERRIFLLYVGKSTDYLEILQGEVESILTQLT